MTAAVSDPVKVPSGGYSITTRYCLPKERFSLLGVLWIYFKGPIMAKACDLVK